MQRSKCPRHIDTIKNQRVVLCLFVLIFQGDREPLKKLLGDICIIFLKKFESHCSRPCRCHKFHIDSDHFHINAPGILSDATSSSLSFSIMEYVNQCAHNKIWKN